MVRLARRLVNVVKRVLFPSRGDLRLVRYRGREWVGAYVPDDERFALLRELVLLRVYESKGVRLEDVSGTVLDAGGHVGLFSLLASQYARRVIVLEASRENAATAGLNAIRNGRDNVDVRNRALWHEQGTISFATGGHTGGGAAGNGDESVQTVTLDDVISELGAVDLLKIDIEGAEYDVLSSAGQLAAIGAVVGELHDDGDRDPRRIRLRHALEQAGFSFEVITERDLFSRVYLRRLLANWSSLEGNLRVKLVLLAYFLLPVRKPIKWPGTRELPLFVARRTSPPLA
jgi:FkbM family methyltransferase